jgi:hypothetical protein
MDPVETAHPNSLPGNPSGIPTVTHRPHSPDDDGKEHFVHHVSGHYSFDIKDRAPTKLET